MTEQESRSITRGSDGTWLAGSPSPNPGGRPKGLAARYRDLGKPEEDFGPWIVRVIKGQEEGFKGSDRLRAYELWVERAHGKAPLVIQSEHSETHRYRQEASQLSPEALTEYITHLAAIHEILEDKAKVIEGEGTVE